VNELGLTAGLIILLAAALAPFIDMDLRRARRRRSQGTVSVTLTIDTGPFVEQMQRMSRAIARVTAVPRPPTDAARDIERQLAAIRRVLEVSDQQWRADLAAALGINDPEPNGGGAMTEQTDAAEALADIKDALIALPLSWDFFPDMGAALDDVARLIAARETAAEARGAERALREAAEEGPLHFAATHTGRDARGWNVVEADWLRARAAAGGAR
jgi:hypothetical protein